MNCGVLMCVDGSTDKETASETDGLSLVMVRIQAGAMTKLFKFQHKYENFVRN